MSKGNTFENDLLKLIFHGTPIANIADNAASSPLGSLYVALHTADPGEGGNQSASEAAYTGYARVAVSRNSGGWTISGASVSPVADIAFAVITGGAGGEATHASIGTAASGAGKILYRGAIGQPIGLAVGNAPILEAGSTITED